MLEDGSEDRIWEDVLLKSQDATWKLECTKRDEKFDMHLKALVRENQSCG